MNSRDDQDHLRPEEPVDKELLEARKRKLEEKLEERGLIVRDEGHPQRPSKDSQGG